MLLIFFISGPRGTYRLFSFTKQKHDLENEIENLEYENEELQIIKDKLENDPDYIERAEIIVNARVVGGIQMVDNGEADDKIVAVLESDTVWDQARDISSRLFPRLQIWFSCFWFHTGHGRKHV